MPDPIAPEVIAPAPIVPPVIAPNPITSDAWTTGLDAELLGHAQNLGWHDKTPAEAAREALKAHRSAQLMLGVPADRMVKLPAANADPKEWDAVWQKLGKPADAKYDLSSVKIGDQPLPQADVDWIAERANELNLSQDGALRLAQAHVKRQTDSAATAAADLTARQGEEAAKLAANWGQNAEANLFVAKQTALKLGVTAEAVAALEGKIGYAAVMEMFRSIGAKTGEADFVGNGQNFNGGIMTRDQAVARKAELLADTAWAKRYTDGGTQENRELQALLAIITGASS